MNTKEDRPFHVYVELWHTSVEWAKEHISVGDFVKLRPDYDNQALNPWDEDGIVMIHSGRKCGRVDEFDLEDLNPYLLTEKVGKIVGTYGNDTYIVKVYPYSNCEADGYIPKISKPKTNAQIEREEQNRKEKRVLGEAIYHSHTSEVNSCKRHIVMLGCSLFISDLPLFYSYMKSHRGWLMMLKRKRVGKRVIMGGFISGRLVGYIPEGLAQSIGYLFDGKNSVVARIKNVINIEDDLVSSGGDNNGLDIAVLLEVSYNISEATKDVYYNPTAILDLSLPPVDNSIHPLYNAWHPFCKDINATSKILSIKSKNYRRLSNEYNESIMALLLRDKMDDLDSEKVLENYYIEEETYADFLSSWEERLKSLRFYVPK